MAEMNTDNTQSKIYMKKLLEFREQNEDLHTQNETLSTQNKTLIKQNENLSGQNSRLESQNKEMGDRINSLQTDNEQLRDRLTAAECRAQSRTKQVQTRTKAFIAVLLLIVALLIGAIAYSRYQVNFYKNECGYERRQRINSESDLEKAQDALSGAEEDLEKAQNALSEAEEDLDKFYSGFAEMCEALFGSSSEDFYAEEAFIVLHPGETKNVKIYRDFTTLSIRITKSDEEAFTAQEIGGTNDTSDVEITAHSPGYYTVEFAREALTMVRTGNSWDLTTKIVASFDLLVIVLEE